MTKSRDDEIYEQGVHMGQNANLLQQFADNLAPVITREDEIFQRGYNYGVTHKSSKEDDDEDVIDEEEIEISKEKIESISLRDEETITEVNNESEENLIEIDEDYDYNHSISSVWSKKTEETRKERRRKIINLVNKMTSNEIENSLALCPDSNAGIKEPDQEVRHELHRRKIIDEQKNIYQLISYSKYDNPFREYAERRLRELIAQNPELEEISRYSWFEAQEIGMRDANGKKAYREARERRTEREKAIREIIPITDLEELNRLKHNLSISSIAREYARRRYEEVKSQQKKPKGLIELLFGLFE